MYQALYRKWRPKTFDQVVGQEHITETLRRQVAEGRIGHAYLFTGTRGTGKTTCARILAKAVNCLSPIDGAPCCQCAACRAIDEGTTLDVTELDAASNNGVDQVRALREEAVYTPSTLKKRIYIIDEVHMLSSQAFNALLKILEEPPAHLMFILATTELHKVLPTILSRCQRFTFKRILPRDMEQHLLKVAQAEDIPLTADGAELLARMAGGALRDALSLLDQCRVAEGTLDRDSILNVLGLAGSVQTLQMMRCILSQNTVDVLALFDQLYRAGKSESALLTELSDLARDITVMKAAPEGGDGLTTGSYDRKTLLSLGKDLPMHRFLYLTGLLQNSISALAISPRPRTEAELCLLKCCDESLCGDLTALVARVEKLEDQWKRGIPHGNAAPTSLTSPPATVQKTEQKNPPLPEEASPVQKESAAPKAAPPPQSDTAVGQNDGTWEKLLEHYKGRLPVQHRVFLNMARGILNGDQLTVFCNNDFVKDSLNNQTVLSVLREVTAADQGHPVSVEFTVGPAPETRAAGKTSPPAAVKKAPQSSGTDALDDIMRKGKDLENFKIK